MYEMSYILGSVRNLTLCQANVILMILLLFNTVNGLRTSQTIDLDLMLLGINNQREMEEGCDFIWLSSIVVVSESSLQSLIEKNILRCFRANLNV